MYINMEPYGYPKISIKNIDPAFFKLKGLNKIPRSLSVFIYLQRINQTFIDHGEYAATLRRGREIERQKVRDNLKRGVIDFNSSGVFRYYYLGSYSLNLIVAPLCEGYESFFDIGNLIPYNPPTVGYECFKPWKDYLDELVKEVDDRLGLMISLDDYIKFHVLADKLPIYYLDRMINEYFMPQSDELSMSLLDKVDLHQLFLAIHLVKYHLLDIKEGFYE